MDTEKQELEVNEQMDTNLIPSTQLPVVDLSKIKEESVAKEDLSILNPINAKNEYLHVLQNPDFNKILVV